MHMSRQLEETRKTKFRRGREEDFRKETVKSKNKPRRREECTEDTDLWGDRPNDGC
jgi:hypothetical protein